MHPSEAHAFFCSATPRTIHAIQAHYISVFEDWRLLMHDLQERRDVATAAGGDTICPDAASSIAATIAVELAIIVAIFPEEPAAVLRASWE